MLDDQHARWPTPSWQAANFCPTSFVYGRGAQRLAIPAIHEIVADALVEKYSVLRYDPDGHAEGFLRDVPNIVAIYLDASHARILFRQVIEAEQQARGGPGEEGQKGSRCEREPDLSRLKGPGGAGKRGRCAPSLSKDGC